MRQINAWFSVLAPASNTHISATPPQSHSLVFAPILYHISIYVRRLRLFRARLPPHAKVDQGPACRVKAGRHRMALDVVLLSEEAYW